MVSMRDIAGRFSAVLVLALSLGCGDDPQGPGIDGPPFLTTTVGGEPWFPDDLVALLSPPDDLTGQAVVILQARRATEAGGSETLSINLFTPDPFSLRSYPLDTGGAGEAAGFFQQIPSPADAEVFYSTGVEHTGVLRITGANTTDSVVSGVFGFDGKNAVTGEVREFRGEFRVRYTTGDF
jgi:hypothetical protein